MAAILAAGALAAGALTQTQPVLAQENGTAHYLVVFEGGYALDGSYALGAGYALAREYALTGDYALLDDYALGADYALGEEYALADAYALGDDYALGDGYALNGDYALGDHYALAHDYALAIIEHAGGTVTTDLSQQIGVMLVDSTDSSFASVASSYALVKAVGEDFGVKSVPGMADIQQYALTDEYALGERGGGGPEGSSDALEDEQWSMQMINTEAAHAVQAGWRAVDVGVLDTGIDGAHLDFFDATGGGSNVDCARGRNSVSFVIEGGPGVGNPDPCVDNGFHGTHVAGIIGAQANGYGIVGVAPNVTLVPVKVCDSSGYCYAGAVVDGITYAGDQQLDVINMSFFVDDDEFQQSTEFKCQTDETQAAFREAVERAIKYAIKQGVAPVAALGNSDTDLANPESSDPTIDGKRCDVVPAETKGVTGTAALNNQSGKATYSNYGDGPTDITAPGGQGTGNPMSGVLSTFPGNTYGAISGTSMASPHAAGVAALIVSQFGKLKGDDVDMSPAKVAAYLADTAVDIGIPGYDMCYGNGRIDALRAVLHDTSSAYDPSAPFCPEYSE